MKKKMRLATISAAMVSAIAVIAMGDTTSTFNFLDPSVSLNTAASFTLNAGLSTNIVAGMSFDPNNPNTLYEINRTSPSTGGGVYPYSFSGQSRLSNSSGSIVIGDPPLSWSSTSDPYATAVGTDSSLYVLFDVTAGIYKISNPLSTSPTSTQMLGNYNGSGDDDPVSMGLMPGNFGLAGYGSNDLIMFDSGLDTDDVSAVVAVHGNGSDYNNPTTGKSSPTIVWQRGSAGASTIRGAVNDKDGYAYFINTTPESNAINGTNYQSLYRVNGNGILQTIGLELPAGISLTSVDDGIVVDPVDGSIWLLDATPGGTSRNMLRVDTADLVNEGNNDFLAPVTEEFTGTGLNISLNGMTFTPDGSELLLGTSDNTDKIWVINVAVPEPQSLAAVMAGALALRPIRRRQRGRAGVRTQFSTLR